ncbi:AraC family transcriptional regulator [Pseudomonas sp. DTU_2021_1001937_2_SI_NGA_ILE_001]|uniref:AraC family transcriptional regulator n=1 Tax=Pseudomonas sp. DTU_2021_1001937_2_SI_NGA_ILE_001 TaxID=3077589 RepID=UPI0028FC22AF|nr:AraC family transcriptional regulator [Pseudomonas sp. DTU_2021_1001937_2_SI_NGA_ILE_001]WNW12886.1 AraC family transcriptional regulator [Pseudomonas sp. DTU_2021_1001937_2_SI_NGA_ILE_001]
MPEPSSLASWTRALRKQLDALGLDSAALCNAAGIDPLAPLPEPAHATLRLWQLAVQASGDPALGLRVSRFVSPTRFHALGYTLVASESLREVFERIVRYQPQSRDNLRLSLDKTAEHYEFRFNPPADCPAPAAEIFDAFAAIYVRTCRNRLGRAYAPLAVHLQRSAPVDPQPWQELFRAPLYFSASDNRLLFACGDFDSHLEDGATQAAEAATGLIWEPRVRGVIETQLPEGEPSAESVAQALGLSLRSLQRHLADEGCRYDLLLNQCRENLALLHICDAQLSLNEVACLLGFSDLEGFSRAFKRWTGLTPQQYRLGLLNP